MAEDWLADVTKHAPGADENVVRKIVNYCGIALRNRDSSLVSFGDPTELGRVREKFLRKKLALTDGDEVLDRGIAAVRDHMQADRTKNRVTVYYLLADWFGKHDLFGGSASAPGSFSFAGADGKEGAAAITSPPKPARARKVAPAKVVAATAPASATAPVAAPARTRAPRVAATDASAAPRMAAASVAPAVVAPVQPQAPAPVATRQSLYHSPDGDSARPMYIGYKDEGGGMVLPHWAAIVALVAAIVAAVVLTRPA